MIKRYKIPRQTHCRLCHRGYETDFPNDNQICPICTAKQQGKKSMLERAEYSEVNGGHVK